MADTPDGRVMGNRVLDRRWRWETGYAVSGALDRVDDHGRLIGWTVRSPYQLATILLDQMGEIGYSIDPPPGLALPTYYVPGGDHDPDAEYLVAINGIEHGPGGAEGGGREGRPVRPPGPGTVARSK